MLLSLNTSTYLEVFSTQAISSFNSVLRTFISTIKLTIQTLKRFFRFFQVTGIINSLTIGIGIKMSQSNIQPNGSIGRLSLLNSFLVNAKQNVVPVGPTHNSNSFNLLQLIKLQVTGSPQLKDSCCQTLGEGDTFPVFRQLISCRSVLNRTVSLMFFEAWETFLSWLGFCTVVLTLFDLKVRGFLFHRDSNEFTLRKHLDRMPYGCKSPNGDYLSGCNISVCCITAT